MNTRVNSLGGSIVTINGSMTPDNVVNSVPPSLTIGADEKLVIFKENTHLHYDTGFALYPFQLDLKSTFGEPWDILSSNPLRASMFTQNTGTGQKAWVQSATYFSGDDYYDKGDATMTLTATYNNDTNRATTGASGQVTGDYGKVADPVNMVVTGQYVSTLLINIQASSNTIIPDTVAGNDFTAILTSQGTVWAWGTNVTMAVATPPTTASVV